MQRASQCTLELVTRLRAVELMVFDVDGVLTDGRLYYGEHGEAMKSFHVHDGQGLKELRRHGVHTAVLSGRASPMVTRRAAELGIDHVLQGIEDKRVALDDLLGLLGKTPSVVGFMGDDWVDVPVMNYVGFAATVPNAAYMVASHAHWVSQAHGGRGAVRELCDLLLDARGELDDLLRGIRG
jgi:3-deoxy-D-manno-octulosonate 8-phosphate phosphatase (KDO 8-P phosphatase)